MSLLRDGETFTLTDEHLALLKRMGPSVEWNDDYAYAGVPGIDPKRPYGNSDVLGDVVEVIGVERAKALTGLDELYEDGDPDCGLVDEASDSEALTTLHRETATALAIILTLQTFDTGTYRYVDYGKWERVQ